MNHSALGAMPTGALGSDFYVARICRCINACEDGSYNSTCVLQENAKCYRKLEIIDDEEVETAGCLSSVNSYIDQCNQAADPDFLEPTDFKCCWDGDLCNDRLHMEIKYPDSGNEAEDTNIAVALIISFAVAFAVGLFFIGICCMRFKQREKKRKKQLDNEKDEFGIKSKKLGDLVAEYSTPGACSSGSGMPLLVQRTIARQIEILRELGTGRYGTVMLGRWRDEFVAVKMFNSRDEDSWYRETEIYQTVLLRHENVLCFVASDINGTGSWTELFLITDYHENGSLHDYLQSRSLDVTSALKLAHTAASGLAHLHTEIIGTQGKITNPGKPAIAHRDIKSKNILVKNDGACCIADMGLAVKFSSSKGDGKGELNKGKYKRSCRQGTKRYMAPEVLNGSLVEDSFDDFKASDVYSFALVLWEILTCTAVEGHKPEYHVPYYDDVGSDPDFDEMRKVVQINRIRPEISSAHAQHVKLSRYVDTMSESWAPRSESRLTMLRIRKTLGTLLHGPCEDQQQYYISSGDQTKTAEYVSDRSNSSGFPTHGSGYFYDSMNVKNSRQEGRDYIYNDVERGRNHLIPNGNSLDSSLFSNRYSDSC